MAGCSSAGDGATPGSLAAGQGNAGDAARGPSPPASEAGQLTDEAGQPGAAAGPSPAEAGPQKDAGAGASDRDASGGPSASASADAGSRDATTTDASRTADSATSEGGGTAGKPGAPVFSACRFHFGTLDSIAKAASGLPAEIDLFTPGWIGQSDTFDMKPVCDEIKSGAPLAGAIPAMVSYIIAFTARRDVGLQDCNVSGTTNLCKYGATYIRGHRQRILDQYKMYAQGFAQNCGTQHPLIWLMEPDYYQYSVGGDAMALTPTEAGTLMADMVAQVKQYLPNAIFSLDISPWMPNDGAQWYPNFQLSDFAFINTSGGGTDAANTKIRSTNSMTWAGVHRVTGKPILADTGYGAAGASAGYDAAWGVAANINARMADGVVSITQYNPNQGGQNWPQGITSIRSALQTPSPCP